MTKFRVIHRYLGFFLVGVMAMYSITGALLIFRRTDFLKKEITEVKEIQAGLNGEQLQKELNLKPDEIVEQNTNVIVLKNGEYAISSGTLTTVKKELPYLLNKMTKVHKATHESPLYWLNLFFASALLFFVVSSFFMFPWGSKNLRKGLVYTAFGIVLFIILLLV